MKEKIAYLSIFANLFLAIIKIIMGIVTTSSSIFAEGIHSSMDILSSVISLIGIKISKKPVDKEHPYGHYKHEVVSGLIITIILFLTGIWIIFEAIQGFINPNKIIINYIAIIVMVISSLINEIMARLKIYFGKKENSLSLISDGVHSRVDVYASLVVLFGIFINKYWIYTDSTLALLIGLYIIKESFELGKDATESLLDVYAGDEIELKIIEVLKRHDIKHSQLKTLKKGTAITANIVISLPNKLTVSDVSKITSHLRNDLINEIENLKYVSIQVESSEINENYFEPTDFVSKFTMGKGFGWKSKGKMKKIIPEAKGLGPNGFCICPKCGHRVEHKMGVPCSSLICHKCNLKLTRKL